MKSSAPNIAEWSNQRGMMSVGHVAGMGKNRSRYRILVEIPEGRTTSRTPRSVWMDNIKMDLKDIYNDV